MASLDDLRNALEQMAAGSGRSAQDASEAFRRAERAAEGHTPPGIDEPLSAAFVVDSRDDRGRGGWVKLAVGLAAGVAMIAGAFALPRGSREAEIETNTPPEQNSVTSPATTTTTASAVPVDPWDFEVELIEVEGLWSVDANSTSAWGVPIAAVGAPSDDSDQLFKLDLASNAVVATVPIRDKAVFVAAADDAVWVSHFDGWVSRIDPETELLVDSIDVGGSPWWIDVGVDSVWVAVRGSDGDGGSVVRIDPVTNSVRERIEIRPGWPTVVMEGAGGVWAWNSGANTAVRIDPGTDSVVATVELEFPGLGFGVGSEAVWRAAGGRGEPGVVSRIDSQTNSIGENIEIEAPDGSVARPTGAEVVAGSAWVPFEYGCEADECLMGLARIDEDTSAVVAVELIPSDSAIVVSVGPSTVWVAGDGQLVRVDI